jgi:hypothetical protein
MQQALTQMHAADRNTRMPFIDAKPQRKLRRAQVAG